MATFRISPFMETLATTMKSDNLAESSADHYMKCLYTLNGKAPFTTLAFLKNKDTIEGVIKDYSESTKRNYYSAILASLKHLKDKASYKKTYAYYAGVMAEKTKEHRDTKDDQKKSDRQMENWIDWTEVSKKAADMRTDMARRISQTKTMINSFRMSSSPYMFISRLVVTKTSLICMWFVNGQRICRRIRTT